MVAVEALNEWADDMVSRGAGLEKRAIRMA